MCSKGKKNPRRKPMLMVVAELGGDFIFFTSSSKSKDLFVVYIYVYGPVKCACVADIVAFNAHIYGARTDAFSSELLSCFFFLASFFFLYPPHTYTTHILRSHNMAISWQTTFARISYAAGTINHTSLVARIDDESDFRTIS